MGYLIAKALISGVIIAIVSEVAKRQPGLGALIVPQSLARLHHRRDLTYRPIVGAPMCPVALAFPEGPQSELLEDFIGVVRGRKPGSSRGPAEPPPKRTAREKAFAKQAARAAAGKTAGKSGRTGRRPR